MKKTIGLLTCVLLSLLLNTSTALAIPPGGMTALGNWTSGECSSMAKEGDILACINGLAIDIYDISNPGQHILLKRLLSEPTAVFISGGILYIAERSIGLHAYNLSDPSSPVFLATSPIGNYILGGQVVGSYGYFVDNFLDLVILDLTTPTSPVEVGRLSFSESIYALAVSGDAVYVAGNYNLHTIDASDPANPFETDTLPVPQARDIEIQGDHAFVRGSNVGFYALDLSNPLHPVIASTYPATSPSNYFRSVGLSGDLAYVSSISDTLWVFDISDPTAMVNVAKIGPVAYGDGLDMLRTDNRLWIRNFDRGVYELDLAVPLQPALMDRFVTGSAPVSIVSDGTMVFAASTTDLSIFDWSIPESPTLLAQLDPVSAFSSVCLDGDLAFVSDDSTGVRILDVSAPSIPLEIGLAPGQAGRTTLLGLDKIAFIHGLQGLRIYDWSDPTAPVLCSEMSFPKTVRGIAAQGSLLYIVESDFVEFDLSIIDVSDPYLPLVIGQYNQSGNISDMAVHENFVYLAANGDGVKIVSVSDPAEPILAATWNESIYPNINIVQRIELDYPTLRVASLMFGAFVVDVGDPLNPQTIGSIEFFNTFPWGVGHAGPNTTLIGQAGGLWFVHHDFALSATPETPVTNAEARLMDIYPNPFNPATSIAFDLPANETVSLRVFDLKGRLVKTLLNGEVITKGRHEAVWDGTGNGSLPQASGTYFFRLEAGKHSEVIRGLLVK